MIVNQIFIIKQQITRITEVFCYSVNYLFSINLWLLLPIIVHFSYLIDQINKNIREYFLTVIVTYNTVFSLLSFQAKTKELIPNKQDPFISFIPCESNKDIDLNNHIEHFTTCLSVYTILISPKMTRIFYSNKNYQNNVINLFYFSFNHLFSYLTHEKISKKDFYIKLFCTHSKQPPCLQKSYIRKERSYHLFSSPTLLHSSSLLPSRALYYIPVRFVGGGKPPVGHAHNILSTINTPSSNALVLYKPRPTAIIPYVTFKPVINSRPMVEGKSYQSITESFDILPKKRKPLTIEPSFKQICELYTCKRIITTIEHGNTLSKENLIWFLIFIQNKLEDKTLDHNMFCNILNKYKIYLEKNSIFDRENIENMLSILQFILEKHYPNKNNATKILLDTKKIVEEQFDVICERAKSLKQIEDLNIIENENKKKRDIIKIKIEKHLESLPSSNLEDINNNSFLLTLLQQYFFYKVIIEDLNLSLYMTNKKDLFAFLKENRLSVKYTLQDHEDDNIYCKKALDLINKNANTWTQSEKIEMAVKAKLVKYGNATLNNNVGDKIIVKESHGIVIKDKAYDLLNANREDDFISTKFIKEKPPSSEVMSKIKEKFHKKEFVVGQINRKYLANLQNKNDVISLTGNDTHINIAVEDPKDDKYLFIIGNFTSTNDENTIKISDNQEATGKDNKKQYWRSGSRMIRVRKNEFEVKPEFDSFCKKEETFSLIKKDFKNKWPIIAQSNIEHPFNFTFELIEYLMKLSFETSIKENDKFIATYKKSDEKERSRKETIRTAQKKRSMEVEKANKFKKFLNAEEKFFYALKERLESKQTSSKEQIKKNIEILEKEHSHGEEFIIKYNKYFNDFIS